MAASASAATRSIASLHGETLDALCWRARGSTADLAAVYAANPGLAAAGPILPAGTEVLLPATSASVNRRETVQLWN